MRQSVRLMSAGTGCGLLGWPLWIVTIQCLEMLPANARPALVEAIASGLAPLLPGMIYLARRFDTQGAKGLGWVALGMLLGIAVPVALFVGLLALLGPLVPRG